MPDRQTVRVLAVEVEDANLASINSILRASGCDVIHASNGTECLRLAASAHPDIILLDVKMEGMDGYATAAALHQDDATSTIPIVMMTAVAGKEERLRALRAGAVDFLSQPVDPEELRAKVASLARARFYNEEMKRRHDELGRQLSSQGGRLQSALEAFARFVPQEFIRILGKSDATEIRLGDQVQLDLAILFSDIRSFTAMSEKMTPQENFAFLNSYLARMNPFVWENGGFIDKYMGDAIMALFPQGSGSALSAAIAMLAHMPVYNAQRAHFNYPPVRIGIGVHAGKAIVGVIGHNRFMQGTAISDAVNLASRLEELTKLYGVSLIVSNHVLFDLEDPNKFDYRFLDKLRIRGKEEAVSVYEVFDGDDPEIRARKRDSRSEFEKGVYDFHAGRLSEAMNRFDSLHDPPYPDPPVEIYRKRCVRALKLRSAEVDELGSNSAP